MKEALRAKLPERIARLEQLADSKNERIALEANRYLVDRAYGRPTERIAGDADEVPVTFTAPSDAQMAELARKVLGLK